MPILMFAIIFMFCADVLAESPSGDKAYVSVREAKIKSRPEFLAPSVADVKYGTALNVLKDEDPWYKVKSGSSKEGYIHTSAISSKKIVLDAGAKFSPGSKGSEDSIILAGKGFNKDVENQYAALNQNLNYSAVNKMEQYKVSAAELNAFVKDGGLNGQ